ATLDHTISEVFEDRPVHGSVVLVVLDQEHGLLGIGHLGDLRFGAATPRVSVRARRGMYLAFGAACKQWPARICTGAKRHGRSIPAQPLLPDDRSVAAVAVDRARPQ